LNTLGGANATSFGGEATKIGKIGSSAHALLETGCCIFEHPVGQAFQPDGVACHAACQAGKPDLQRSQRLRAAHSLWETCGLRRVRGSEDPRTTGARTPSVAWPWPVLLRRGEFSKITASERPGGAAANAPAWGWRCDCIVYPLSGQVSSFRPTSMRERIGWIGGERPNRLAAILGTCRLAPEPVPFSPLTANFARFERIKRPG
jgi:hypothetical protein